MAGDAPGPKLKCTFGLWSVGNVGAARERPLMLPPKPVTVLGLN
jgi:hypothetical protein